MSGRRNADDRGVGSELTTRSLFILVRPFLPKGTDRQDWQNRQNRSILPPMKPLTVAISETAAVDTRS
jgi:hypothetical protein